MLADASVILRQQQYKHELTNLPQDGGLGAALAVAYHKIGYRVFATARNPAKMADLKTAGIETLTLDVLSPESLSACVSEVQKLTGGTLDVLINNAGAGYNMPISDIQLSSAKQLFDLNVFSCIATIQAFLPLLLRANDGAMIVNNTSVAAAIGVPFQSSYTASKAALSMYTECLRLEMLPFNIKVVDLRTGTVKSRFFDNAAAANSTTLPENSIYAAARDIVERVLRAENGQEKSMESNEWAKKVVQDLTRTKPPYQVWRGARARLVWFASFLPVGLLDFKVKEVTGLDLVIDKLRETRLGKVDAKM